MPVEPIRVAPTGGIRQLVYSVADAAEAERLRYRNRKRRRGDCGRGFFEDPDRYALAAMVAMQLADDDVLMRFGPSRSDWAAARHAAALVAPGRGQRVSWVHRHDGAVVRVRAVFKAPDRHVTDARRLDRKRRALEGLSATWVCLSACQLNLLNAGARGAARIHARAMLAALGWRSIPPAVRDRLAEVIGPSNSKTLGELLLNADAPVNAHTRWSSQSTASAHRQHEARPRPTAEYRRRHPGAAGPRPDESSGADPCA